ncbi:hypothetical protein BBC0178_012130 [Bartonella apihabitans]|uniref:Uncharacterized protein n=1 Tax=Bartonella apihabitans TaxID=2750929 RepID=A0A1U9MBJ4_9HYPH|nr:hypothetical protein BBC0178_012130 [Bartonella apihabitans]
MEGRAVSNVADMKGKKKGLTVFLQKRIKLENSEINGFKRFQLVFPIF